MAKVKISEFSSNPALNTDIDSINIAEGCAPSGINDAIRELMSQLKDWQSGTSNDPYVVGSSGSLTLNQGTANGVAYLNGSKVVTSGSALTFNGTQLGIVNGAGSAILKLDGSSAPEIDFYSSGVIKSYIYAPSTSLQLNTVGANPIIFLPNEVEGMRLTSTGLGIGTSSPALKLDVAFSSSGDGIRTYNTLSTGFADVRIGNNTSANLGYLRVGGSAQGGISQDALVIGTGGGYPIKIAPQNTVAATFDTSGNLGLGVTPSAWSGYKVLQAGIASFAGGSSGAYLISDNAYTDNSGAGWKYINSSYAAAQYYAASGAHVWRTAASGTAGNAITFTQAMTLDASGNLGVGETSPDTRAHIYGASTAGRGQLYIQGSGTTSRFVMANSSDSYSLNTYGDSSTSLLTWDTNSGYGFRWTIADTERARIDSSGNLLVGTTSNPNSRRFITSSSLTTYAPNRMEMTSASGQLGGLYVVYTAQSPNDTSSQFIGCDDSSASRFVVRSNGGIANYSANNVNLSDRREKTNFAPAGEYLSKICAIPVQTFNYIDQNLEEDGGLTLGVVAQDVQAVAPELVMESNWGTKEDPKMRLSIYQTDLQYALMKALQELKAEFDAYKASHP